MNANVNEFTRGDIVKVIGETSKRRTEFGEVRAVQGLRVRVEFDDVYEWYENTELMLTYAAFQRLEDKINECNALRAELEQLKAAQS